LFSSPKFPLSFIKLNVGTFSLHLFSWLSPESIKLPEIKNNPQDTILKIVCYFKHISYPYLIFLLVIFPHQSSQLFFTKLNLVTYSFHLFSWLSPESIKLPEIKNNPRVKVSNIVCYFKDISYPYLNFLIVVFPHQSSLLVSFIKLNLVTLSPYLFSWLSPESIQFPIPYYNHNLSWPQFLIGKTKFWFDLRRELVNQEEGSIQIMCMYFTFAFICDFLSLVFLMI